MKRVFYTVSALKELRSYSSMRARVTTAITDYAANPDAHRNQVTNLVGVKGKRMRVGDFRVLFDETDEQLTITKIGPRGAIYR